MAALPLIATWPLVSEEEQNICQFLYLDFATRLADLLHPTILYKFHIRRIRLVQQDYRNWRMEVHLSDGGPPELIQDQQPMMTLLLFLLQFGIIEELIASEINFSDEIMAKLRRKFELSGEFRISKFIGFPRTSMLKLYMFSNPDSLRTIEFSSENGQGLPFQRIVSHQGFKNIQRMTMSPVKEVDALEWLAMKFIASESEIGTQADIRMEVEGGWERFMSRFEDQVIGRVAEVQVTVAIPRTEKGIVLQRRRDAPGVFTMRIVQLE